MSKESAKDFSRAFYPFLHADERKPGELMEELGFSLLEKARESVEVKSKFFAENKEPAVCESCGGGSVFGLVLEARITPDEMSNLPVED